MRGRSGDGASGGAAPSASGVPVRALLDNVADMVTVSDREGRIVYANPATERVSGYAPEEFAARNPFDSMHPEDRPRCQEAFEELADNPGMSLALEHRVRRKDGAWRWVEGTFVSLFEDPGVGGLVAILRDVTERKEAQEALREGEERYRTLFESIDEGFCIVEVLFDGRQRPVDYRFLEVNPAFERHTGLHGAVGKTVREMAPGHEEHWFETYGRIALTGEPERFENRAEALGGRWYEVYAFRVGEPEQRRVAILFSDASERKRADDALRESEERYRLAAEAAGLGRWQFVPETGELVGDDTFNGHHGAPPGAELGFGGLLQAVHPNGRGAIRRRVAAARKERDGYGAQYRVVLPDGTIRWTYSRGRFVEGAGSAPDRLVGVSLDVTARRELQRERERARAHELTARAEATERERISRELHDRVAHNMAVAHQSLQLHAAYASSDPSRAAAKLEQAAEATKAALDQTRDLSAQLARSDAQETRRGLGAALRDLLAAHAPPGVETALSVAGEESSVPTRVGEQAYLVMREAVRNAVAHSGCGRIEVTLKILDGELVGRVEDDGVGFDPHGGPDGRRENASRAGVGLGSMRERTELLGGRLDLCSEPGRGTAVEVRAPLEG